MLLLIASLLHTLNKGDHQTQDNDHSGWEGYTDGCEQHSEGSNWYVWLDATIHLTISVSKVLECMDFLGVKSSPSFPRFSYKGIISDTESCF